MTLETSRICSCIDYRCIASTSFFSASHRSSYRNNKLALESRADGMVCRVVGNVFDYERAPSLQGLVGIFYDQYPQCCWPVVPLVVVRCSSRNTYDS